MKVMKDFMSLRLDLFVLIFMKIFNKYKIHLNSCVRREIFPYKIRLFKRTKWHRFKQKHRQILRKFKFNRKKKISKQKELCYNRFRRHVPRFLRHRKKIYFFSFSSPFDTKDSYSALFFKIRYNHLYKFKKFASFRNCIINKKRQKIKKYVEAKKKALVKKAKLYRILHKANFTFSPIFTRRNYFLGKLLYPQLYRSRKPILFFIKGKTKRRFKNLKFKIRYRLKYRQVDFWRWYRRQRFISLRIKNEMIRTNLFKSSFSKSKSRKFYSSYTRRCPLPVNMYTIWQRWFRDARALYVNKRRKYLRVFFRKRKSVLKLFYRRVYRNYKKRKIFRNFKHNRKIKFQFKRQKFFNRSNYSIFKNFFLKINSFNFNFQKKTKIIYKNFFFIYSKFYNILKYRKHKRLRFKTRHYRKKRIKFLSYFHYTQRKFLYFNKKLIDLKYSKNIESLTNFLQLYKKVSKIRSLKNVLLPFKIKKKSKKKYYFIKEKIPSSVKLLKFYNLFATEYLTGAKYSFLKLFPKIIRPKVRRRKLFFFIEKYTNLQKAKLFIKRKLPFLNKNLLNLQRKNKYKRFRNNYKRFKQRKPKKNLIFLRSYKCFKNRLIYKIKYFRLRLRWFQKRFIITKPKNFKRRKLNLYRQSYRIKKFKNISRIRYRKRVRFTTNHSIALRTKYNIVKYFNSSFNIKLIKKDLKSLRLYTQFNFLKSILVRQLYKIDILLWRLKICSSTASARQLIFSKSITINDNYIKPTYFVKKGDVIKFFPYRLGFFLHHPKKIIKKKKKSLNLLKIKSLKINYYYLKRFYSFLEYDKKTNIIVITKDFNQLSKYDLALFLKYKRPKLKLFYHYITH